MDQQNIFERLSAHDKVRSNAEVIEWKKTGVKKTLREKRQESVEFFGNARIPKDLIKVEKAINSITNKEKLFKKNLKEKIAEEEYEKRTEVPKVKKNRAKDFKTPPDCFDSPHICYKDSVLKKFKCNDCYKEFNSILLIINIIFVIPKFIERNRTFHIYYRCEQGCEKIHALLNKIESNLLNVKNKHERHRIMIAR